MTAERVVIESKKIQSFIDSFRANNEYNPISINEYNAKFRIEFNHFLENIGFSDETIQLFKEN